jgi:hypothetical protein
MAGLCDAMKMIDDSRYKTASRIEAVGGNEVEDIVEIGVCRIGDDQDFRRDRSSPLETMSAFIASRPGAFRYSPRP